MLPGGSSRIPPFELTSPEPEIVPPVIVVRRLMVITPGTGQTPPLISSVVAFRALVPKFAVPPSIITVGIVPGRPRERSREVERARGRRESRAD